MAALWKTCQCLRLGVVHKSLYPPNSISNLLSRRNYKPKWVAATLREVKRRKDIETDSGGEKIFHRSTFLEWFVLS